MRKYGSTNEVPWANSMCDKQTPQKVFHDLLRANKFYSTDKNLQYSSFSCTCTSNFQSEAQFKVNSCLKANPLLTIMQHNKATTEQWGDVLAETQPLWNCQLPTRDGCSEPGLTFFHKDKLNYNLATPNWTPGWHSPPQTLRGRYSEDLGSKTVRCEPRLRTATSQLPSWKSHARAHLDGPG